MQLQLILTHNATSIARTQGIANKREQKDDKRQKTMTSSVRMASIVERESILNKTCIMTLVNKPVLMGGDLTGFHCLMKSYRQLMICLVWKNQSSPGTRPPQSFLYQVVNPKHVYVGATLNEFIGLCMLVCIFFREEVGNLRGNYIGVAGMRGVKMICV